MFLNKLYNTQHILCTSPRGRAAQLRGAATYYTSPFPEDWRSLGVHAHSQAPLPSRAHAEVFTQEGAHRAGNIHAPQQHAADGIRTWLSLYSQFPCCISEMFLWFNELKLDLASLCTLRTVQAPGAISRGRLAAE